MSHENPNRRTFLKQSIATSVALIATPSVLNGSSEIPSTQITGATKNPDPIWKNKKDDMQYRMLGRTGMMVSEIVLGTFPFDTRESFPIFEKSIDRGINYFDCAFAYGQGRVEANLGNFLAESKTREQIFLSTKLSAFYGMVDRYVDEIFQSLSATKQHQLEQQAQDLIEQRMVKRSGYHFQYFGGQDRQYDQTYFRYVVLANHGLKPEWKQKIKENAHILLQGSLERLKTDYVDVLHIPHGCAMPEMMDDLLQEIFSDFKRQGLVRASAVSFHNDVTGNLLKATSVGYYDLAMFAYNIANHAALEHSMSQAYKAGLGMIAMKVAKLFSMRNQPQWQRDKLAEVVPDKALSEFAKCYKWALQNKNLSCCVSQMETLEQLADNLQVIGS